MHVSCFNDHEVAKKKCCISYKEGKNPKFFCGEQTLNYLFKYYWNQSFSKAKKKSSSSKGKTWLCHNAIVGKRLLEPKFFALSWNMQLKSPKLFLHGILYIFFIYLDWTSFFSLLLYFQKNIFTYRLYGVWWIHS